MHIAWWLKANIKYENTLYILTCYENQYLPICISYYGQIHVSKYLQWVEHDLTHLSMCQKVHWL